MAMHLPLALQLHSAQNLKTAQPVLNVMVPKQPEPEGLLGHPVLPCLKLDRLSGSPVAGRQESLEIGIPCWCGMQWESPKSAGPVLSVLGTSLSARLFTTCVLLVTLGCLLFVLPTEWTCVWTGLYRAMHTWGCSEFSGFGTWSSTRAFGDDPGSSLDCVIGDSFSPDERVSLFRARMLFLGFAYMVGASTFELQMFAKYWDSGFWCCRLQHCCSLWVAAFILLELPKVTIDLLKGHSHVTWCEKNV